jgi:hypothetical protein
VFLCGTALDVDSVFTGKERDAESGNVGVATRVEMANPKTRLWLLMVCFFLRSSVERHFRRSRTRLLAAPVRGREDNEDG